MANNLKNMFYRLINEYAKVFEEVTKAQNFKHPFGAFIRRDITDEIRENANLEQNQYVVKGSCGAGRYTAVPWIAVFDKRITTSAQRGVYIVYLLNKDKKELYLTLNQGATDVSQDGAAEKDGKLAFTGIAGSSNAKSLVKLKEKARDIRNIVGDVPFNIDEKIKCGASNYDAGAVCYKKYTLDNLPDDNQLFEDLKAFVNIYAKYAEWHLSQEVESSADSWWPSREEYTPGFTKNQWLEILNNSEILGPVWGEVLAMFHTEPNGATCKMIAEKFGDSPYSISGKCTQLAKKIHAVTGCPLLKDEQNEREKQSYWPILFLGRDAKGDIPGTWIWKLRSELYEALTEFGIEKHLPIKEVSKLGKFDSWEIVDEATAIKTCDKSFFEHKGSGVPKNICWFFDAEDIPSGESNEVKLLFAGDTYIGKIRNDTTDRRRIQIFWNTDLANCLEKHRIPNATATFKKIDKNKYEIIMNKEGEKEMTIKDQISAIKTYIAAKGFNYDGSLIENFYLGLKSKPFVILAGTSGTGKTRLVRLFAEAIGAEYKLVSVRPDWSDSSDLFGHVDLNQKFVEGSVIKFVKQAELNPSKPYFLCLDEMNLARVEYYMSDILSAIETRRHESGMIVTDPIDVNYGNDSAAAGRYGKLILPGNLYIVGTVNMDETTFPFSKKVLDRANTIEFSYVDLLSMPSFSTEPAPKVTVDNDFLASKYITLNDCDAADKGYITGVCTTLSRVNGILEMANAHIGYRVRDEIVFYMLNNKKADLLDEKAAFDNQIMQKILPRIQGSSESIKKMLEELLKICDSEKFEASAKKINFMIKRYDEDGFTSYWL